MEGMLGVDIRQVVCFVRIAGKKAVFFRGFEEAILGLTGWDRQITILSSCIC